MKETTLFFAISIGVVGLGELLLLPLLDRDPWLWTLGAAAVALAAQGALYVALGRWRRDPRRFVRGILAGAVARVSLVVAGVVWAAVGADAAAVPFLLALTVYLFALLMVEATLENRNVLRSRTARR